MPPWSSEQNFKRCNCPTFFLNPASTTILGRAVVKQWTIIVTYFGIFFDVVRLKSESQLNYKIIFSRHLSNSESDIQPPTLPTCMRSENGAFGEIYDLITLFFFIYSTTLLLYFVLFYYVYYCFFINNYRFYCFLLIIIKISGAWIIKKNDFLLLKYL